MGPFGSSNGLSGGPDRPGPALDRVGRSRPVCSPEFNVGGLDTCNKIFFSKEMLNRAKAAHALAARVVLRLLPPLPRHQDRRPRFPGQFVFSPRLISSPLASFLVRMWSPIWISFLKRMRFFDLDGRNSIIFVCRRRLDIGKAGRDVLTNLVPIFF